MSSPDTIERLSRYSNDALELIGVERMITPEDILTYHDYVGENYGVVSNEGRDALKLLASTEGIFLGPIYTAKVFSGLVDHIKKGKLTKNETVVFVHTGGVPEIFAFKDGLSS